MTNSAFAHLKIELEESCKFLQTFTIARRGYTPQDATAGIERVREQCDRLNKLFASGPDAKEASAIEAAARRDVASAEERLKTLRKYD